MRKQTRVSISQTIICSQAENRIVSTTMKTIMHHHSGVVHQGDAQAKNEQETKKKKTKQNKKPKPQQAKQRHNVCDENCLLRDTGEAGGGGG